MFTIKTWLERLFCVLYARTHTRTPSHPHMHNAESAQPHARRPIRSAERTDSSTIRKGVFWLFSFCFWFVERERESLRESNGTTPLVHFIYHYRDAAVEAKTHYRFVCRWNAKILTVKNLSCFIHSAMHPSAAFPLSLMLLFVGRYVCECFGIEWSRTHLATNTHAASYHHASPNEWPQRKEMCKHFGMFMLRFFVYFVILCILWNDVRSSRYEHMRIGIIATETEKEQMTFELWLNDAWCVRILWCVSECIAEWASECMAENNFCYGITVFCRQNTLAHILLWLLVGSYAHVSIFAFDALCGSSFILRCKRTCLHCTITKPFQPRWSMLYDAWCLSLPGPLSLRAAAACWPFDRAFNYKWVLQAKF